MGNIDDFVKSANKSGKVLSVASDAGIKEWVSTGLLSMDDALGGGLPTGGPILLQGRPSSGKSAFAYMMAGKMIDKHGGKCLIMQTEAGFDPKWAAKCGLPLKNTIICDNITDISLSLDYALSMLQNNNDINCFIFDSISAIDDTSSAISDSTSRGARAIPQNKFFKRLCGAIEQPVDPLLMFMEHLHPNVASPYGGLITTGGETKKYMSILTMRFFQQREGSTAVVLDDNISNDEIIVEAIIKWEVIKNKGGPQGGSGTFNLGLRDSPVSVAGRINNYRSLFVEAMLRGVVKKSGSWFRIGDDKYQGEANFKKNVTEDTLKEIVIKEREKLREGDSK